MPINSRVLVGVLAIVVVALGYLYYDRTRNDVVIQLPSIELKK